MIFNNRYDAAMQLIPLLEKYKNEKAIVLAIPRGGVQLGYYIAKKLNLPVELLLTKKIGHPYNPELAIGSVSLDGQIIDRSQNVDQAYIEKETRRIRNSLMERYKKFKGNSKPVDLKDKVVIIVDDGIATGYTMLASIEMVRLKQPKKIVVAVPVAPPSTAVKLKPYTDEWICLTTPDDFMAVGQFYRDFSEVTDEEVIQMLGELDNYPKAA